MKQKGERRIFQVSGGKRHVWGAWDLCCLTLLTEWAPPHHPCPLPPSKLFSHLSGLLVCAASLYVLWNSVQ